MSVSCCLPLPLLLSLFPSHLFPCSLILLLLLPLQKLAAGQGREVEILFNFKIIKYTFCLFICLNLFILIGG